MKLLSDAKSTNRRRMRMMSLISSSKMQPPMSSSVSFSLAKNEHSVANLGILERGATHLLHYEFLQPSPRVRERSAMKLLSDAKSTNRRRMRIMSLFSPSKMHPPMASSVSSLVKNEHSVSNLSILQRGATHLWHYGFFQPSSLILMSKVHPPMASSMSFSRTEKGTTHQYAVSFL